MLNRFPYAHRLDVWENVCFPENYPKQFFELGDVLVEVRVVDLPEQIAHAGDQGHVPVLDIPPLLKKQIQIINWPKVSKKHQQFVNLTLRKSFLSKMKFQKTLAYLLRDIGLIRVRRGSVRDNIVPVNPKTLRYWKNCS